MGAQFCHCVISPKLRMMRCCGLRCGRHQYVDSPTDSVQQVVVCHFDIFSFVSTLPLILFGAPFSTGM